MTLKRTPAALSIELRPSRLLVVYLIGVHGLCALCLLTAVRSASAPPWLLMALAGGIIFLSLCWQLYRQGSDRERVLVLRQRDVVWYLQQRVGAFEGELGSRWVLPWVVGLRIKKGWRSRYLLIPFDSCDTEAFRCLKQQLRMAPLRG